MKLIDIRLALIVVLALFNSTLADAWWEAASTWDPRRGRYVSTEEYKRDHGVKEVCQSTSCWDGGRFRSADDWNKNEEERAARGREKPE